MRMKKQHVLQRLAVLTVTAALACTAALGAAAANPVNFEEKRSTTTTPEVGVQKTENTDVKVQYQIGTNMVSAEISIKGTVAGVPEDEWSFYEIYKDGLNYTRRYQLSQPLTSVEQVVVSVPYDGGVRTNETYFVFHVPAGTVVKLENGNVFGLDIYKGKTIADVKAVVESGRSEDEFYDGYEYDETDEGIYNDDESVDYQLKKGYLYRVSMTSTEDEFPVEEHFYFYGD